MTPNLIVKTCALSNHDVWQQFHGGDTLCRNTLVEAYLPLVRGAAERMRRKLVGQVPLDDLMSSGTIGLMDAVGSFDPKRGVKFETYCVPRIRGAMFDELRSMDWIPRLTRSRHRQLSAAVQRLEVTTGRPPTETEIIEELRLPLDKIKKIQCDSTIISQMSLEHKVADKDGYESSLRDTLTSVREEAPENESLRQDLKDLIQHGLTRAERLIIILYYYEAMTMLEIGDTLDLSESRVSQVHSQLLTRLRARFEKYEASAGAAA